MTKNVSGLFDSFKFWGFKVPPASLTRQHGGRAHLQKLQSRLKGVVDSGNLLLLWLRRESTTLCCSNCKSQSGQCSRPADWRPPTIGQLRQQHTFFSAPGFSAKWQLQLRQLPAAAHDAALLQVQLHFFGQHPTDAAEMFRYFRSIGATISLWWLYSRENKTNDDDDDDDDNNDDDDDDSRCSRSKYGTIVGNSGFSFMWLFN